MDYLINILLGLRGPFPYLLIFTILMVCGLGVPIPEDITLIAAGLMSYYKVTDVYLATIVSMIGVLLGDSVIFLLGAKYGRALTKKWIFHKLLPDDRLDMVAKRFNEKGNHLIFFARFMPGLRAPLYFSAGTLHVPFRIFIFYDGLAALLSVPAIVYSVYYFGSELDSIIATIRQVQNIIAVLVFSILAFFIARWYFNHKKAKANSPTTLNGQS